VGSEGGGGGQMERQRGTWGHRQTVAKQTVNAVIKNQGKRRKVVHVSTNQVFAKW